MKRNDFYLIDWLPCFPEFSRLVLVNDVRLVTSSNTKRQPFHRLSVLYGYRQIAYPSYLS